MGLPPALAACDLELRRPQDGSSKPASLFVGRNKVNADGSPKQLPEHIQVKILPLMIQAGLRVDEAESEAEAA